VQWFLGFRHDYGWSPQTRPSIGQYVNAGTAYFYPNCFIPGCNDTGSFSRSIQLVCRQIFATEDYFKGDTNMTVILGPNSSYAQYEDCCRLSAIRNHNNDSDWRVRIFFNRQASASPRTNGLAREFFNVQQPLQYQIPGVHPLGGTLIFGRGNTLDSGLPNPTPTDLYYSCFIQSNGSVQTGCPLAQDGNFTVNFTNGLITWTPRLTGLFAMQFDVKDADTSNPSSSVPLDFIMEIVIPCTTPATCNVPPFFVLPFHCCNVNDPTYRVITNRTVFFYRGIEGSYPVCANDNNTNQWLTIFADNLPPGATYTAYNSSSNPSQTCGIVKWNPAVDAIPQSACFAAYDDGRNPAGQVVWTPAKNLGQYCILMDLLPANLIYITGIIRDFHKNHTNFNRGNWSTTGNYTEDLNKHWVRNFLGPDRKPFWNASITPSTVNSTQPIGLLVTNDSAQFRQIPPSPPGQTLTSPGFYDWFFTDPLTIINKAQVQTIPLSSPGGGAIFTFLSTSWYPIDNQLFGNEGDPHNRYFTYELNTYIRYDAGASYRMSSSDDMWVFIDNLLPTNPGGGELNGPTGWSLEGIHTTFPSNTINMDRFAAVQRPTMVVNETYRCDIFYAHRASIGDPEIQIQLPNFTLCNGLTSGVRVMNFNWTTAALRSQMYLAPAATWTVDNKLLLINQTTLDRSVAYFSSNGTPVAVQLLYGFLAEFSFNVTGRPEGFSFIFHNNDNPAAIGFSGFNLGYSGITKSFVVEFDNVISAGVGDNAVWQNGSVGQLSVHTAYELANDAREYSNFSLGTNQAPGPLLNFTNGTEHRVRIEYGVGQLPTDPAWLRVYLNDVIRPIVEVQVDARRLSTSMGGAAYVGFTAANTVDNTGNVYINYLRMLVVPVEFKETIKVSSPTPTIAGVQSSFRLQTRDACGNNINIGGQGNKFVVNYHNQLCPIPGQWNSTPIVDLGDGTYQIPYNHTRVGTYEFNITIDGNIILDPPLSMGQAQVPFQFDVLADFISPDNSRVIHGEIPELYTMGLPNSLVVAVFRYFGRVKVGPFSYDLTNAVPAAGYTGGATELHNFLRGTTLNATDYLVMAVHSSVGAQATSAGLPTDFTALGATQFPPTGNLAYVYIGQLTGTGAGLAASVKAQSKAPGEAFITFRGQDTRSASFTRNFTLKADISIPPCGAQNRGYARVNSIYDDVRILAGTPHTMTVRGVDQYNNLKTQSPEGITASYVPSFLDVGNLTDATFDMGYYEFDMIIPRVGSYSEYVRVNTLALGGIQFGQTVLVVPGLANINKSDAIGNGVTAATAGQTATFDLDLADIQANPINFDNPEDVISGELVWAVKNGTTVSTYMPLTPPVPFIFTWVDDPANNCNLCKLQVTYNATQATEPGLNEFSIAFTINNGTNFTKFGSPNIVAGPIWYPSCTHTCARTQALPAGDVFNCIIQAKDGFGNRIFVGNTDFQVANVIFPGGSLDGPATVTALSLGQYQLSFIPKVKGSLTFNIQGNVPTVRQISGSPVTDFVSAGKADKISTFQPVLVNSTVKAGVSFVFTVHSVDKYGNARDGVALPGDYSPRLRMGSTYGNAMIASNSTENATALYTFNVSQTSPVGLYNIEIVVTLTGEHITGSPFSYLTVIPAETYPPNTIAFGSGLTGCTSQNVSSFQVQARDIYNNTQIGTTDLTLYSSVISYNGVNTTASIVNSGPGLYTVTYTCPTFVALAPTYTIYLAHSGIPAKGYGPWITSFTARVVQDGQLTFARLQNISNVRAGEVPTPYFQILPCADSGCTQLAAYVCSTCYAVTITKTDNSTSIAGTVMSSIVPLYNVTFIGVTPGIYKVRVFESNLETEASKNATNNYYFNVTTGYVDPLQSSVQGFPAFSNAGESHSFSVTLRDRVSNPIGAGQTVSATATKGTSTVPITCTFTVGDYVCNYNLTLAGVWTVTVTSNGQKNGTGTGPIRPIDSMEITVGAGPPVCQNSFAALDAGQSWTITAGAQFSTGAVFTGAFIIRMRDAFGNPATWTSATPLVFTLQTNPTTIFTPVFRDVDTNYGTVDVSFVPTKIDTSDFINSLTITLGGCPIQNASIPVTILPAAVDPAASNTTRSGQPTVAGNAINFTLNMVDIYGNPWFGQVNRLTARDQNGNAATRVQSATPGSYIVSLPGTYTHEAWIPYDMLVSVDGSAVNVPGTKNFTVIADVRYPPNTQVIPVDQVTAGVQATIDLVMNDQYGNPCLLDNGLANIGWNWAFSTILCPGGGEVPNITFVPAGYVNQTGATQYPGQGVYRLPFTPYIAGTYTWFVMVDGQNTSCTKPTSTLATIEVGPALPHPSTSYFTVTATTFLAGSKWTVTVNLRDQYGNLYRKNGANVVFGNPGTTFSATYANPGQSQTATAWLTNGVALFGRRGPDVLGNDYGNINGQYEFTVNATEASPNIPIGVLLSYGGTYYLIKGSIVNTQTAVISVNIAPGVPETFTVTPNPIMGTAALPSTFRIDASDKFQNPVSSGYFSYYVTMVRNYDPVNNVDYSITATTVSKNDSNGNPYDQASFISYWHGSFSAQITMKDKRDNSTVAFQNVPAIVLHATCNWEYNNTKYRCPNRDCQAAYTGCPSVDTTCEAKCASGSCRSTSTGCCVSPSVFCATTHSCLASAADCAPAPTCPSGTVACTGWGIGQCRQTTAECPSTPVCVPGTTQCSDGITCVLSLSDCPTVTSCPAGTFRCAQGGCVIEFSDCPTPKTCSSGVLCPDGSCQTTFNDCPSIYSCDPTNPNAKVRCFDGSCRPDAASCPTPVTCPIGYLLCENGIQCTKTVAECSSAIKCPLNQVRCPDGSCQHHMLFCPTTSTCPSDKPVKCPDGSCKGSARQCVTSTTCPGFTCPDGTCIICPAGVISCPERCPSPVTCPLNQPVLCIDGSCTATINDCASVADCSAAIPWRCPDGSCRTSSVDCPTRIICPSDVPVLCPDNACAVSVDLCTDAPACAAPEPVRCPIGGCAASLALCPTIVTCPPATLRCLDGTCRNNCSMANNNYNPCPQFTCPQSSAGQICVADLSLCPTSFTCPPETPVRCTDSSCRATSSLCPTTHPDDGTTLIPCPDGLWAPSQQLCATPVTCPDSSPYKCWDETCRSAPSDCPTASGCSDPTKPYQCPNGACVAEPWNDPTCQSSTSPCPFDRPTRCLSGTCINGSCPAIYNDDGSCNGCCPGVFCSDGRCVTSATDCPAPACPANFPELCDDGFCAANAQSCPAANGCPSTRPIKCGSSGLCISQTQSCPTNYSCTAGEYVPVGGNTTVPAGTVPCDDGSCRADVSQCPSVNGCPIVDGTPQQRCADGSCAETAGDCTSASSTNNKCPQTLPFRCSNGFCTSSSSACPPDLVPNPCNGTTPFFCASGDCVATSAQCPIIAPCGPPNNPTNTERCKSGICRPPGQCPLGDTCPTGSYRCPNGLCTVAEIGCNINVQTGCPSANSIRCSTGPIGLCVNDSALCVSFASPDGCADPSQSKCTVNGACVTDPNDCPLANGCPRNTPFRCSTDGSCVAPGASCPTGCTGVWCADGTCKASLAACNTTNQCPITAPIRCADGTCKKYPAGSSATTDSCPSAVVCEAGQFLCVDGSCAAAAKLCKPALPCPDGQMICSQDFQCHASCMGVAQGCPPTSPVECPTGACKATIQLCGYESGGPAPPPCAGSRCLDGSCVDQPSLCAKIAVEVANGPQSTWPSTSSVNAICPTGSILCWNGLCVAADDEWMCPPIPACPTNTSRCSDGTCNSTDVCQSIKKSIAKCNGKLLRCEDGLCREKCLAYDGCGLKAPYHCWNRECAQNANGCNSAASISRRLLALPDATPTEPCFTGCYAQVKSSNQRVSVDVRRDSSFTLALNSLLVNIMTAKIASGGLLLSVPNVTTTRIIFKTVAESRMRDAVNSVHPSRVHRDDLEYDAFLTFAQTVVSPAFECDVDSDVVEPFAVNVTVSSLVDSNRRLPDGTVWIEDICLASLFEIGQFSTWRCLFPSQYDRRLNCPPSVNCTQGQYIVRDPATAPPPDNLVQSVINRCTAPATTGQGRHGTVYAFITSPLAKYIPPPKPKSDPVQQNIVAIILGVIFGLIFLLGLIYLAFRGYRYRDKYKKEQKEAADLKEEVDAMRQFGPQHGAYKGDDTVTYESNPLAQKVNDLKQAVNDEELKLAQAEQKLRMQESDIRGDHISNIKQNRDNMMAELEKLKAQLRETQATDQRAQFDDDAPPARAAGGPTQDVGTTSGGGAYREGFEGYQAPRAVKKKEF